MATTEPRYDGLADWYDATGADWYADAVASLLGPGDALCLNLGCGTGQHFAAITSTGRTPVGLELSADQLRIARARTSPCRARDSGVVALCRCGILGCRCDLGVHGHRRLRRRHEGSRTRAAACRPPGDLRRTSVLQRALRGEPRRWCPHRASELPGSPLALRRVMVGRDGIRRRVGMRHLPLAELFTAVLASGFGIERVEEPGPDAVPVALAIAARRP